METIVKKLFDLIPFWVWPLALSVSIGVGVSAYQMSQADLARAETAFSDFKRETATAATRANELFRKVEKELSDATIQHATKVDGLLAESRRNGLRNARDSDRLRSEAIKFAASSGAGCSDSTAPADIEAGPSAAMVLADLLGRADARANDLAQAADEARLRGLACEADYDRAAKALRDTLSGS
jgi:hypothetical protein